MMITTFDIPAQAEIGPVLERIRRSAAIPVGAEEDVRRIVDDVRANGDRALFQLTARYDGFAVDGTTVEVEREERLAAWETLDPAVRSALSVAESRIASFAREGIAADWNIETDPGISVGQAWRPLDRVGLYVPGGRYPYPSTVLMTGVPAREAGVGEIIFCVPPGSNGEIDVATLAATTLVGECRVFRVGGAQAVAAMAYGTESIPRCRMVAGPGNIYVTLAKRIVSVEVTIDLEAGPSEAAAYIDASVDLSFASADMLAQLEHDPISLAVIVSESRELLQSAAGVIAGLADGDERMAERSGAVNMVWCKDRRLSIEFLNELAPEHLELMVEDAESLVPEIRAAGCLFVGPYSAVALGDYIAGPSHVLPTGGTAARLSGLNAACFRRSMNVISYTKEGFVADAGNAGLLARLEGLDRHAASLDIRNR